ncbi:hypothetical protein KFK09_001634 [Dendrobium nobile]|uniref:Uncharacterized protein n=1 Tax=Dendrobium nobile TaxID=94219 RepID=A0A8T3C7Z4_DENNO|nr:hypothetical protein KFK09_001634 [Dendrobium nobile]
MSDNFINHYFPEIFIEIILFTQSTTRPLWKRSRESTKDVRPIQGCMSESLLDDVNLYERGQENQPRM